jgi:hypothetical protein
MRWGVAIALAGCGFRHGVVSDATHDSPPDVAIDARIDAAPDAPPDAVTCPTLAVACPAGITTMVICNNACWASCTAQGDEPTASAACTAWGGRLAPLQTQADQDCVHLTVFPGAASWIGFEQSAGATTLTGGWTWNSDGITPSFTNWSGGQPNDGADGVENGEEQCAYMSNPSGAWQDTACSTLLFNFSCRHGS